MLGVHFSLDKTLSGYKNFSDLFVEMRAIIETWKIRNLTLEGKVIIFRSSLASKPALYCFISAYSKMCCGSYPYYTWGVHIGQPNIKHSTTIASYCDGGLKYTDIEAKFQSLKFSWITRLKDQDNFHPWKVVANKILRSRSVGGTEVFHTNLGFFNW